LRNKRCYRSLASFSYKKIKKSISRIQIEIEPENSVPFPKERSRLYSWYEHRKHKIHLYPNGEIRGGNLRLLMLLVDFSFIRSLVAHCYGIEGGKCYDAVSIFLLDLFRWFLGYRHMTDFLKDVRHKTNGAQIRLFAGLNEEKIPCPATFSLFRAEIGEELYTRIFHILVSIVEELGLITGRFLSTDGTLFPTFARYKGCPYASENCRCIEAEDVLDKIREKVKEAINHLNETPLPKEIKVSIPCPNPEASKEKERRIEVVSFILDRANPAIDPKKDQTPLFLGLADLLNEYKLVIKNYYCHVNEVKLDLRGNPVRICCPKVPVDIEARLGWRRSKKNPSKKESVYGFQVVIITSIEPELGIELPVAVITKPGSTSVGELFIPLREQIKKFHPQQKAKIDLGDCGLDDTEVYEYILEDGSIPVIAYNKRGEDLSDESLKQRGYNQNGWPYAPCGYLCRPNGFDSKEKRASFSCRRQCLSYPEGIPNPIRNCSYQNRAEGFTRHFSHKQYPRLINPVLRGTRRWKKLYAYRTASERTNGAANDINPVLDKPKVRGLKRAAILGIFAATVVLLKRFIGFILKINKNIYLSEKTDQPKYRKALIPPKVPLYLWKLLQLE